MGRPIGSSNAPATPIRIVPLLLAPQPASSASVAGASNAKSVERWDNATAHSRAATRGSSVDDWLVSDAGTTAWALRPARVPASETAENARDVLQNGSAASGAGARATPGVEDVPV